MAKGEELETISVTEAVRRGLPKLVAQAERGHDYQIARRGIPVAELMSSGSRAELEAMKEDLLDLALVLARVATDDGSRVSFDRLLSAYGETRESLETLPEAQV